MFSQIFSIKICINILRNFIIIKRKKVIRIFIQFYVNFEFY